MIHNLVQNALDAVADRPDGRVSVRTEAQRHDAGGVRAVRLVVVDNGPGFPDKVLKRAFEPYVTTKSKGTGLGPGGGQEDRRRARGAGADRQPGQRRHAAELRVDPRWEGRKFRYHFQSWRPRGASPPPPRAAVPAGGSRGHIDHPSWPPFL